MSKTALVRTLSIGAATAALWMAGPALAAQPQDAWITTLVKIKLLAAEDIDALAIDVDTFDGNVTLHGAVESPDLKQLAGNLAAEVDDVREVRNVLAVVPEQAARVVAALDEEIRARVENVLERDQALETSDVRVASVHDGIVVLSGDAETPAAHRRALEDARSVEGVRSAVSQIRSPNELADREIWREAGSSEPTLVDRASDSWITTQAKVRLLAQPGISPLTLSVDTRGGVVTLFGRVPSEEQKGAAEREVADLRGVRGVRNELQVIPDVVAVRIVRQDDRVKSAVEQRLGDLEALREADIDVEVSNGVVRVTGTVDSFRAKERALTAVRATEGVASIVDGLRVRARAEG